MDRYPSVAFMNAQTLKIIETVLHADASLTKVQRMRLMRLVRGEETATRRSGTAQPPEHLLSPAEAAHYLSISKRTLARYVRSGRLVPGRINGRVLRYRRDDLDRLVFGHVDH
jgi:excisionase family DNA binding protein